MSADREPPLVKVENLTKHYPITRGVMRREVDRVRAVDGISFEIDRGETLGLVGESGCGKSTAAATMLRLEEPTDGRILIDGEDITAYDDRELVRFRRTAQIVFQDPNSSFDPRMSVGEAVAEPLRIQGMDSRERRREIVANLLERVGMSPDDVDRYPHELSGGQKQRIALARALSVNPDVLVADEPVSALDESIQADILALLSDIQDEFGLAILFISHDLEVVRDIADRIAVMYLGEIVETGETDGVFDDPKHPYTRALLASIPDPDPRERGVEVQLTGDVPDPSDPPSGCRFHTRCPEVVQPEGYEFAQENWRAVLDFRLRLRRRAIDIEAHREYAVAETTAETVEGVTADQLADALRHEFDLPDELSDPAADEILERALALAADGDIAEADELLSDEFDTVCETRHPEPIHVETDREAACHLLPGSDSP